MTDEEKKHFDDMKLLVEAIRFNHNISGDINNFYVKNPEHEIEVYQKLMKFENSSVQ